MNYKDLTKAEMPEPFQKRIERFNKLFSAATDHDFEHDDLYKYELECNYFARTVFTAY